jgi:hypothetical protein
MTTATYDERALAGVSAVLRDAGFDRAGRVTWLRSHGGIMQVVAVTGAPRDAALAAGVWVAELDAILHRGQSTGEPVDLSRCHVVLPGHRLGDSTSSTFAADAAVHELDAMRTLLDVESVLRSGTPVTCPASPDVRVLYVAALAVMTGAPGVLALAEQAATRLAGTDWAPAANHVYAMVATAE